MLFLSTANTPNEHGPMSKASESEGVHFSLHQIPERLCALHVILASFHPWQLSSGYPNRHKGQPNPAAGRACGTHPRWHGGPAVPARVHQASYYVWTVRVHASGWL